MVTVFLAFLAGGFVGAMGMALAAMSGNIARDEEIAHLRWELKHGQYIAR